MYSPMVHSFANVPKVNIPRSSFNRTHSHKTTFNAGYLIPAFVDEIYPGDSVNLEMTGFVRLATPLFPIMDDLWLDSHFFFVPLRILWDKFVQFMGERKPNPDSSVDYLVPQVLLEDVQAETLFNYMSIPVGNVSPNAFKMAAFYGRAYNMIWNEWYRDQNLQNSVNVELGDGPDDPTDYVLLRRGKRHDYFTSCLPEPQKGPDVQIPLGTVAPVTGIGTFDQSSGSFTFSGNRRVTGGTVEAGDWTPLTANATEFVSVKQDPDHVGYPGVFAQLSEAASAPVNELRQAFMVQALYERDMRGGTRYIELVRSHFNVISPDFRVQRPEYLGGGSTLLSMNTVAQTTPSEDPASPIARLSGVGTFRFNNHRFVRSFTEHGVIIGLVSVRSAYHYMQGVNRMFSRRTKLDFIWPVLAGLGEQAVLMKEIYATGTDEPDDSVFGYQERFAEARYKPSIITGKFDPAATDNLEAWHLAQYFLTPPALNSSFIVENPPMDRVLAVPEGYPNFFGDFQFKYYHARALPVYGVPVSLGRF